MPPNGSRAPRAAPVRLRAHGYNARMAAPNILLTDSFLPCFRGEQNFAVGTDDITFPQPRAVQVLTAGNLVFVDALGREHTRDSLAINAVIDSIGGHLLAVRTVRGSSTVTSIRTAIW